MIYLRPKRQEGARHSRELKEASGDKSGRGARAPWRQKEPWNSAAEEGVVASREHLSRAV